MAARRALVFKAGTVGLICAASEVEITSGDQDRQGSMRPVRSCTNPATEVLEGEDGSQTGLCAPCHALILASQSVSTVLVQRPRNN
jgi:hypothetical protein